MTEIRQQVPGWLPERFFQNIKEQLEESGEVIMEWAISKQSLIATLNYIRAKGFKCEWIEIGVHLFDIKIRKQ